MKQFLACTSIFLCMALSAQKHPVRIGIAGMTHAYAGRVFDAIGTQNDVKIVGFAEPNNELAMRLPKEHGLPASL